MKALERNDFCVLTETEVEDVSGGCIALGILAVCAVLWTIKWL